MTFPENAYNPSLICYRNKLYSTFRAHDRNDWRTNLYISEVGEDLKPLNCSPIKVPLTLAENSHEDGRLFQRDGSLWLSWTVSQYPTALFRCAVCFGELVQDDSGWSVGKYFYPNHGSNDFSALEKNWFPFDWRRETWCYYDTQGMEQTFLRLDGSKIGVVAKSRSLEWGYGPIHGGAICQLPNGNLLHFFNSRTGSLAINTHRYQVGCAELAGEPPFNMLRISRRPVLYGEEGVNRDGFKFYKPSVVFATGAIWKDGHVLLAHGWNDSKCKVVRLKMDDLYL